MKKLLFVSLMILLLTAVAVSNQSCKATRTVTTTATCSVCKDSTETRATITSKTVEDYVGAKKR